MDGGHDDPSKTEVIVSAQGQVVEVLKNLGNKIAEQAKLQGLEDVTPLLASFAVRVITLQQPERFDIEAPLSKDDEEELIKLALEHTGVTDDPAFDTVRMQVTFESYYASELQRLRSQQVEQDQDNQKLLAKTVEIGTNLQSNQQVASLYRTIFKLLLTNSCVDKSRIDRNVEREIAAALESVFPQAGLNAFNIMNAAEKQKQINDLISIVLGIRLFNKEIKKGGAGIPDVLGLASAEVDALYEQLELESTTMGDVCYTYSDVINLEYEKPGTIAASAQRLQEELVNRRQYILLVHQLQHEVFDSLDVIKDGKQQLREELEHLKTLVGLRTSVPKEQVYPKFHVLSGTWKALIREREKNEMRKGLLVELQKFKETFKSSLLEEDLALVKQQQPEEEKTGGEDDPDSFVKTVVGSEADLENQELMNDSVPARLIKETTAHFMSLPLEHQGYCPWTIVMRGGLLLPGNPNLGVIRHQGHHYSFVSYKAMREFCEDPDKYIEGVILTARKQPALIHLLCLQDYIPYSDISDLLALSDTYDVRAGAKATADAGAQTAFYINTDPADPHYEWNEWNMRRKAIQMANLTRKKTRSTQTHLSHFRRDNETQTYIKARLADGTMPGRGTQTRVEKGTNVERVRKYATGLRGKTGPTDMKVVELKTPEFVTDHSNPKLNKNN